jgi:4,5-dihydroxyphthalate decarboxylase
MSHSGVELTLAINDYDHVRDLVTGRVPVEGVSLTALTLSVEEIFFRFTQYREWDVSELSLGKYSSLVASGDDSLVAIPVFPSRVFRHSGIYVRGDGSVAEPAQLAGRRVGVPEWVVTAGIYTRGILVHEYGVALDSVEWFQGGVNEPGREELVTPALPDGVSLTPVADRSLEDMLLAGDLDAIVAPRAPTGLADPDRDVVRLIADHRTVEAEYFRRTGVFPIMHVVAIKADVHERHPWVGANLMRAFEEAKRRSLERFDDVSASRFPLPWTWDQLPRARELLGDDPWPYGLEPNRPTLDTFLGYAHEQGANARRLKPEELFPKSVLSDFRI